jgi:CheY-like chemotaxis protein
MGARIAVVDDNLENLRFICFLTEAFGHTALRATNGAEAVALVAREVPDLVLLDIHMPGMDGFETLRVLRVDSRIAHVPVVALTALAMVGDRDVALAAGFDGYITKPIQPDRFATEIDAFLPVELRSRVPTATGEER